MALRYVLYMLLFQYRHHYAALPTGVEHTVKDLLACVNAYVVYLVESVSKM